MFYSSSLGTFIVDAYTKDQKTEITDALNEICAPIDNVGWASSGIYCFWNYETKEILYIGLTKDFGTRFKQHNGLIKSKTGTSIYKQISQHFQKHEKIGFSIFPQAPLAQPKVSRNHKRTDFTEYEWLTEQAKDIIYTVEGSFIEACKKANGRIPKWNKADGAKTGQKKASLELYSLLSDGFLGNTNNPLIAKSSLREIAQNDIYEWYEINLHGARMAMLSRGYSFDQAISEHLSITPYYQQFYDHMVASHYLEKELQL
ncbi:MAG: GIY-YIG nuclease family protein [Chloroflexi bacterium]|nr:GIY-YIG nuclease family protein [Chloroflexota bacterium]